MNVFLNSFGACIAFVWFGNLPRLGAYFFMPIRVGLSGLIKFAAAFQGNTTVKTLILKFVHIFYRILFILFHHRLHVYVLDSF